MGKYLFQVSYVGEGVKGLLKDGGSKRRVAVEELYKSLGVGPIEAFYYAFGDTDLFIIADGPDNAAVAAGVLTVTSTGACTVKTTVLLTPEEVDEAAKKSPRYNPPGQ
jgi:uncharacterized protein with GYD domain